jgi:hypothetical protein
MMRYRVSWLVLPVALFVVLATFLPAQEPPGEESRRGRNVRRRKHVCSAYARAALHGQIGGDVDEQR